MHPHWQYFLYRMKTLQHLLFAGACFVIGLALLLALAGVVLLLAYSGGQWLIEWAERQSVFLQILAAAAVLVAFVPALALAIASVIAPSAPLFDAATAEMDRLGKLTDDWAARSRIEKAEQPQAKPR